MSFFVVYEVEGRWLEGEALFFSFVYYSHNSNGNNLSFSVGAVTICICDNSVLVVDLCRFNVLVATTLTFFRSYKLFVRILKYMYEYLQASSAILTTTEVYNH